MTILNKLAGDVRGAADRLTRLAPSHRDPHRFHEEKSELVDALHDVAALLEGKFSVRQTRTVAPVAAAERRLVPGTVRSREGQIIRVEFRNRPRSKVSGS